MKHRVKGVAAIVGGLLASGAWAGPGASQTGDFEGRYLITEIVGYAETSAGLPGAKRLLGQTVVIASQSIDVGDAHCVPHDGFKRKRVLTEPLLKEYYGVARVDVGLPQKTVVLDSGNCTAVFRVDPYRILLGWDGVVARAVRDDQPSAQGTAAPK
jgi:hypothetical protein